MPGMDRVTTTRTVKVELNEHDASQLLTLIRQHSDQDEPVWRRYWDHLAQKVQHGIEASNRLEVKKHGRSATR
jgi:hypothetical protein